jgi:glycerol-3-phosphate O-acyltransferase
MLAYYRNTLLNVFISEAIISCSMLSLVGSKEPNQDELLWEKWQYLYALFSEEFVVRDESKS